MKATYTKLKKEDVWGIRIAGSEEALKRVKPGFSIEVERKDGETRTETIDQIVFTGSDFILAIPAAIPRKGARIGT